MGTPKARDPENRPNKSLAYQPQHPGKLFASPLTMSHIGMFLAAIWLTYSLLTVAQNTIVFPDQSRIHSYPSGQHGLSILRVEPRPGANASAYKIVDPRLGITLTLIKKGFPIAGYLVSQGLQFDFLFGDDYISSFMDSPSAWIDPSVRHLLLYISHSNI